MVSESSDFFGFLVNFLTLPRRAVADDLFAPGKYGQDEGKEGTSMFNFAENTSFLKFGTRMILRTLSRHRL